jgi:MFS family permease
MKYWRPTLLVFLPFAIGYYLSYLFRTINALISAQLTEDLGLDASHLGLMTSVYFLTFAAVQLPLGVLLDRYGSRRVQSALLLVAVAGATLFAMAESLPSLVVGRALIGLGVAGALIGGLKAIPFWFPRERLPLVNGCYIMLGALGAVTATSPAEWLQAQIGWRGLFEVLAVVTAGAAVLIFMVVPDPAPGASALRARQPISLKAIYGDPRFWRLAPLSTMCISTAWALQGLWAAPWLADVEGLQRPQIVRHLFVMAAALSAGALLLGIVADQLRKRGIGPDTVLGLTACGFVAAELSLILGVPSYAVASYATSYTAWAIIAGVGAATVLSYSILGDYFPKEIAGQANAALNLLHIGGAFVLQEAVGLIVNQWASHGGHYPPLAYKTAFALIVLLQIGAIVWFLPSLRMARTAQSQPAE